MSSTLSAGAGKGNWSTRLRACCNSKGYGDGHVGFGGARWSNPIGLGLAHATWDPCRRSFTYSVAVGAMAAVGLRVSRLCLSRRLLPQGPVERAYFRRTTSYKRYGTRCTLPKFTLKFPDITRWERRPNNRLWLWFRSHPCPTSSFLGE